MSHKEEQAQEVEALESIFPSEFEVLKNEPFHSLRFTLKTDRYDNDPDNEAKICVVFTFTNNYPDEAPEVEIDESENITDESDVIEFLNKNANENLGMPMLYTLVCALIEKMNKDNEERKIFEADEKERKDRQREEEEMKRFEGTKVTVESFLKWKLVFDKEMNDLKKSSMDNSARKPTGKNLFERDETLFNSDLQFINSDEPVEVDEALFQNLDELDLDDDGEEYVPGEDDDDDDDDDE